MNYNYLQIIALLTILRHVYLNLSIHTTIYDNWKQSSYYILFFMFLFIAFISKQKQSFYVVLKNISFIIFLRYIYRQCVSNEVIQDSNNILNTLAFVFGLYYFLVQIKFKLY